MKVTILVALFLSVFISEVKAEFLCQAEVSYKWRNAQEQEVAAFWARIEKVGAEEEKAKATIGQAIVKEQIKAQESCKIKHENLSGCISSKLNAFQSTIGRLGFASRKKLEESVISDCELQQGHCLGTNPVEIVCKDLKPPVEESADETAKKDKKDKKGKKK